MILGLLNEMQSYCDSFSCKKQLEVWCLLLGLYALLMNVKYVLQVSNLKKIVEGIVDYYQECLNQHLNDFSKPDVAKIGNDFFFG